MHIFWMRRGKWFHRKYYKIVLVNHRSLLLFIFSEHMRSEPSKFAESFKRVKKFETLIFT